MSTASPYESTGRTRQKERTRAALIAAAADLVAQGGTPTVEEAAAAAGISRTAAYRYFPNQRALLIAAHPEIGASSLLPPDAPDDAAARLDLVVDAFVRLVASREPQLRTMLRLALEPGASEHPPGVLRQGRAIGWINDALSPLRSEIAPRELHRLVLAIRSATGIEARVWLTDVAGLSSGEAMETMRWSARAMFRFALFEHSSQAKQRGQRRSGASRVESD